jgi:hypothetical protein
MLDSVRHSTKRPRTARLAKTLALACQSRRVKSCGPSGSQDLAFQEARSRREGLSAPGSAARAVLADFVLDVS